MSTLEPLVLVRHAEAEHHLLAITGGWTNSYLTERGIHQAQLAADRLKHELADTPVSLGCSSLTRAQHTAQIIGRTLGLDPVPHHGLSDLNNGIAAGKTHQEARILANKRYEPYLDWHPYPEAESWRQFFQRVVQFIEPYCAQSRQPSILVSHSAVIHVIIAWWLGLEVESRTFFNIAPASLTVLTVNRWGERTLERLNDTAHLYAMGLVDPIQLSVNQAG